MPCPSICLPVLPYLPPLRTPSKEQLEDTTVSKTQRAVWHAIAVLVLLAGVILLATCGAPGQTVPTVCLAGIGLAALAIGVYLEVNIYRYTRCVKEASLKAQFSEVKVKVDQLPEVEEGVTYQVRHFIHGESVAFAALNLPSNTSPDLIRAKFISLMSQNPEERRREAILQAYAILVKTGKAPPLDQ